MTWRMRLSLKRMPSSPSRVPQLLLMAKMSFVPLRARRLNQIVGEAGAAEAAEHHARAVGNVGDGGVDVGEDFIFHSGSELREFRVLRWCRGHCKPRGSGLRSGAGGLVLFRRGESVARCLSCEERAGVRAGEIVLEESAEIGFVVNVHFEARVAAMMNLRVRGVGFGAMLGEAAGAEVRREERRRSAEDRVGAGAVARWDDDDGRRGAFDGKEFVDVARLNQRQIERNAQNGGEAERFDAARSVIDGDAFGNLAIFAEDLPAVFASGLHRGLVVGDDEDFVGALDAAHRGDGVGEHRVSQSEAFFGSENADEALLGVAEIFDGKEQRAHCGLVGAFAVRDVMSLWRVASVEQRQQRSGIA